MKDRLFMETTRIAPERTVAEIQTLLAQHEANQILLEFEGCKVSAVSFRISVDGKSIPFRLPCRWQAIEQLLRENGRRASYGDTHEDWARRVAWRQIFRWAQAQFALVETSMVKVHEVFFPYIQGNDGLTLFEKAEKNGFMALEFKGDHSADGNKTGR